eukprot:3612406-Rhodomonas_salina.3
MVVKIVARVRASPTKLSTCFPLRAAQESGADERQHTPQGLILHKHAYLRDGWNWIDFVSQSTTAWSIGGGCKFDLALHVRQQHPSAKNCSSPPTP